MGVLGVSFPPNSNTDIISHANTSAGGCEGSKMPLRVSVLSHRVDLECQLSVDVRPPE